MNDLKVLEEAFEVLKPYLYLKTCKDYVNGSTIYSFEIKGPFNSTEIAISKEKFESLQNALK